MAKLGTEGSWVECVRCQVGVGVVGEAVVEGEQLGQCTD